MSRRTLAALGAALVLGACDAPTIPERLDVYRFQIEGTDPPLVFHWPAGAEVRVYAAGGEGERQALLASALATAAAEWNRAVLYGEYRLVPTDRPEDANVVLGWTDVPLPVDVSECTPGTEGDAVTTFCRSPSDPGRLFAFPLLAPHAGTPSRVRVVVLLDSWVPSLAPERTAPLVVHELGHALGLGSHPDPGTFAGSVMLKTAPATRLSAADVATVQVLYHTAPDLRP